MYTKLFHRVLKVGTQPRMLFIQFKLCKTNTKIALYFQEFTLNARGFSCAVSGFSRVFIVSRGFAIRNFGPRPAKSICRTSEKNLGSNFTNCSKLTIVILHSVIQASSVLKWSSHVLVKESAIECLITRHLKSNTTTPHWQRWVEPNSMLMLITLL